MDTLTHALSGALLGRATKKIESENGISLRLRILVCALAAAFPDIDFIARFFGLLNYLETHRGITHSIILVPLWSFLLAHIFSFLNKGRYSWRDFYFICFLGISIHILGDVITAYGTMVFAPFSDYKFSIPTTFIIDLYFSGIIIVALLVSMKFHQHGKTISIIGLLVLFVYVFFQFTQLNKAENIANEYVNQQKLQQAKVYVMAQPLSPFHWKAVIESNETYHISYIDLFSENISPIKKNTGLLEKINSIYLPIDKLKWHKVKKYSDTNGSTAKNIWSLDLMKPIRQFMLYPIVDDSIKVSGKECTWFKDHRFILDGVRAGPFLFGACRDAQSPWQLYHYNNGDAILLK